MTESIIDIFKVIHIDEQYGECFTMAFTRDQRLSHALNQGSTIGQMSQWVKKSQAVNRIRVPFGCGDIGK